MTWNIYLSGEIHTAWREKIEAGLKAVDLPVNLSTSITDNASSDDCGDRLLGAEDHSFWKDHKASKINSIRIRNLIEKSDVVIVRFGEKYKQWNAAFDAGSAAALGRSIILLHDPELTHALKEADDAVTAVAQTPEEVVNIMKYATNGTSP
ncbi:MAG: YtoQ family protein [Proteobacteria bacterium]|nr:YtoQ family protein [Pseudomonadota bacterium]